MKTDLSRSRARKARRVEKAAENEILTSALICSGNTVPLPPAASQDARRRTKKRKKSPSRKSLVRKADTAFSLHIRKLYPVSFFSGKPTECCFHIITRSKHSVRWSLDNAVGSTMGENYEMEFNPHKFITALIHARGLPWYEALVRRSNEIRKHTRKDLELIARMGFESAGEIGS